MDCAMDCASPAQAPAQSRWGKDCREVPWGSIPGPGLKGRKGFKEFMGS
jgi:hypothetical protein